MPDSIKNIPHLVKPVSPSCLKDLDKSKKLESVKRLRENAGRIELGTDGEYIYVYSSEIQPRTMEHLFYNSLKELPGAWIAMEIALARFKKTHEAQ